MQLSIVSVLCLAALFSSAASKDSSSSTESKLTYTVEHSYGDDAQWTKRGTVLMKTAQSSQGGMEQELGEADASALLALAEADGDYRVRVTSTDESDQSVTVETSIEACALYQARFVDTLRLYLGPSGHVQAAEEATSTRACPDKLKAKPMTFKTTVVFRRPSAGQQPNSEALNSIVREQLRAMDRETGAPSGGEPQEQQSSWTRYAYMFGGMMLVQLVIGMFTNKAGAAPAAGAAAGAAAPAPQ